MNRLARFPVFAVATLTVLMPLSGCKRLESRNQLNKGVQAFKSQKYEQAVDHFQQAVELDPSSQNAHIYLATAYAVQVVPGADTPDNMKNAEMAINGFKEVLAKDSNDVDSLKGIAGLYMSTNQYDLAKEWQKKVLAVKPNDAEAAYTVGQIDWTLAQRNAVKDLKDLGLQDASDGNPKAPKSYCKTITADNTDLVTEGLQYLQKAVDIRPTYDDAMAYINLIYRRKADLECGNDSARKADLAQADDWREKSMGTRKSNEAKKAQGPGGIVMDSNGNVK